MPNPIIYTVTMPSGNTYDLVDQGARDLIKELITKLAPTTVAQVPMRKSTNAPKPKAK